ncbi:general substrate transporter [Coniochaeta sp. 2T2.1]|nr:general substrate transporter [Coniochaeta sp. 2T2.1]
MDTTTEKPTGEAEHVSATTTDVVKPDKGAVNVLMIMSCLAFGAASFLFGYDDKVISPIAATPFFIKNFQGHANPASGKLVLTARNQDLVFSVPLVGSVIGGLATSPLSHRLGRKWTLIFAYFFSVVGGFLQLLAPNLATFVIGRFLSDFIIGIAHTIAPLYLSEVVPASMRGRSVSIYNILNLFSGVISTIIVNATHTIDGHNSYRIPVAVEVGLPILLLVLTLPTPESPQWLVAKGRMEEAKRNLRRLRGYEDWQLEDEFRVIVLCEENERELTKNVRFWHLFNRENLKRTITAGSFFSLNQISGVILSTTYTTVFLGQLGVGNPFVLTIVASVCTLAGTIFSPLVIDIYGRRPTALTGMVALFIIDVIAGALAFFPGNDSALLTIAALGFIFNFVWATSFLSISVLLPPEIATPRLRSHTMAYTVACAQTTAVITTFAVPQLTSAGAANLGAKTYLIFAGCMACIIVWSYVLIPETKGRTYAEIDEMYDKKVPMWKWRKYQTSTVAKPSVLVSEKMVVQNIRLSA